MATQQLILSPTTSVTEAVTGLSQGRVEHDVLVSWLCTTVIDMSQCGCLFGVIDPKTFQEVMVCQTRMAADRARKGAGQSAKLTFKVSKRGAISLYGLSAKWPMTLYLSQWRKLFALVGAPEDNAFESFVAANPVGVFTLADYAKNKSESDAKFIANPPSNVTITGDAVRVAIATRE
jgi:hypothetical protein